MLLLGLVSSDPFFCAAVAEQVKRASAWTLAVFPSLGDAMEAWQETFPALLFLDMDRTDPQSDAFRALAQRMETAATPPRLMVLSDEPLPAGVEASDVFTRPLRLGALLGRLGFYQKVMEQTPDQDWPLGPWLFNPRRRLLTCGASVQKLTDKEAELLGALYLAPEGLTREALLEEIWGYNNSADTHTVETHIYRLRRKLMATAPEGPDCLETKAGRYCLAFAWRAA